jgi:hypothetical protein
LNVTVYVPGDRLTVSPLAWFALLPDTFHVAVAGVSVTVRLAGFSV